MIERNGSTFYLTCDMCEESPPGFYEFHEAVNYKKREGWKSKRYGEDWVDVCPECAECEVYQ